MADDLEQQVSAGLVDGQVANFIKDKYTWSSVLAQLELELRGGLCAGEGVDHVDGGGEEHGVTLVAGGESQGDGEMAFSESDAADEHDIGEVVEELQPAHD